MANLEAVAVRIFKEDCVVAGTLVVTGTFDVSSSRRTDDFSEPIDFLRAVGPERDARFVWNMPRRFGDAEKRIAADRAFRLELKPYAIAHVLRETERWQERAVERANLLKAAHTQIDMVELSGHEVNDTPKKRLDALSISGFPLVAQPIAIMLA